MFKTPNPIQTVDMTCNLILPWYTDNFLKQMLKMNYKDWEVFEWGGGCSTVWYSHNCQTVDTLETDQGWTNEINQYLSTTNKQNYTLKCIPVPPSAHHTTPHPNKDAYLNYIRTLSKKFDCIVVDGSYRNEALLISEEFVKPDGIIIFDNYEQSTSGYTTLPAKEYFNAKYKINVYDHSNKASDLDWKTAYWKIS